MGVKRPRDTKIRNSVILRRCSLQNPSTISTTCHLLATVNAFWKRHHCAGFLCGLCRFRPKWTKTGHLNSFYTKTHLLNLFKFGKLVDTMGVHNKNHEALCHFVKCGRGLCLNAKNAIFGPLGDSHPSPNYFSDPKPKFLALYFRDASNGTTRDPLGPGIRVAKIRGAKQSV
jgi:hypothetical protein